MPRGRGDSTGRLRIYVVEKAKTGLRRDIPHNSRVPQLEVFQLQHVKYPLCMRRGFSTIELLIAIAILGTLMAMVYPLLRPPEARLMANEVKAMLQQARYESIKRNQPVAFVWFPDRQVFETRYNSAAATATTACAGDSTISTKAVSEYRDLSVTVNMPTNGIVWLPTGQGRSCTGGPMVSGDIAVHSGSTRLKVVATMGGKVSIE